MPHRHLVPLILLAACSLDEVCSEEDAPAWHPDGDGDGYGDVALEVRACWAPSGYVSAERAQDCDDGDGEVHPGAAERCNGADDDCDGEADEDLEQTWFADQDGDGHGDPQGLTSCGYADGYVDNQDDCDDGDASTGPGADEVCDERDNDCDGETDEDVRTSWYADADGDGSGVQEQTVQACNAPSGYAASAGDCDDSDASISPAASETWNGVDDDCDGTLDDLAIEALASGALRGDEPGQGAGWDLAFGGRFVLEGDRDPGGDDLVVIGAPGAEQALWAVDASWYDAWDQLGLLAAANVVMQDPVDLQSVTGPMREVADLGDELDDPIFVASIFEVHAAVLFPGGGLSDDAVESFGWLASFSDISIGSFLAQLLFGGECDIECSHPRVAVAADLDGLSPAEVVVGFEYFSADDELGAEIGAVAVFTGPFDGSVSEHTDDADAALLLYGGGTGHRLGSDLAAASFTGDDSDDLLIGAADYPGSGEERGAVFLLAGEDLPFEATEAYVGTDLDYRLRVAGSTRGEALGELGSLVQPGDVDGDGYADLALLSPRTERVYIFLAPGTRVSAEVEASLDSVAHEEDLYVFEAEGVAFAASAAVASDLDGDGLDDLAVGAPEADSQDGSDDDVGAVYVFSWAADPDPNAANGIDQAVMTLRGERPGDRLGSSLAAGGDLDDDGTEDLVLGAPGWDLVQGVDTQEGMVYLLLGTSW